MSNGFLDVLTLFLELMTFGSSDTKSGISTCRFLVKQIACISDTIKFAKPKTDHRLRYIELSFFG